MSNCTGATFRKPLLGRDGVRVEHIVDVTVDLERVAYWIASKAATNKSGRSKALHGAVIVNVRKSR